MFHIVLCCYVPIGSLHVKAKGWGEPAHAWRHDWQPCLRGERTRMHAYHAAAAAWRRLNLLFSVLQKSFVCWLYYHYRTSELTLLF